MTPTTLMVRLAAGYPNDALLKLAADLAHRFKSARVIGVSARQPIQIYGSADMYVPADLINWDCEQIEKELRTAEKEFRAAFEDKGINIEWRSTALTYGSIADYVAEQLRAADVLITPALESHTMPDRSRNPDLAELVLHAGRPVLVAGAAETRLDLGHAVVFWKDTREARRAAEDALSLLKAADRVTVVEIASSEDLTDAHARTQDVVEWLARHGVAAEARAEVRVDDETAQLRDVARDAGLIVGGAYGHTRLREWVLGGITRDVLLQPDHCSLVSH